jgi:glycosyltransferase involved in cell wall biosynthesis
MPGNEIQKITVFIPVWNGARFIGRAIESVLCQTFRDFRLVIVDNCSTDNTREIVTRYLADDRVVFCPRPKNIGMLGNFNACLDDVETEYYLVLSHDDFLCADIALAAAYNIAKTHTEVPAIYCETLFVDEDDKLIARRHFGLSGLVDSDIIARRSIISGRNLYGVPLLIRTSALADIRYDSSFPNSCDVDFSIAIGKGKNVIFIPEALVAIRFHRSNNTARIFKSLETEFKGIAQKQGIRLTRGDVARIKISNLMVGLKKKLFFFYLDKIRK